MLGCFVCVAYEGTGFHVTEDDDLFKLDGVLYLLFVLSLRSVLVYKTAIKMLSIEKRRGPSTSVCTSQSPGIKVVKFISALRKIQWEGQECIVPDKVSR